MCKVGRVDGGEVAVGVGDEDKESRQETASLARPLGRLGCAWLASRPHVSRCQLVSLIGCPATRESRKALFFFFFSNATPESIKIQ